MILERIINQTKSDLKQKKLDLPQKELEKKVSNFTPRDVITSLKSTPSNPYRIIAEVKKASPSKGVIREDFNPKEIAIAYEKGGADALSILTEPHFFQGNLEYLTQVRQSVKTPLLRKDFIVDEYQILQAPLYGADFILLIAKALDKQELSSLLKFARSLNMEALVEIHDEDDLEKALYANATIIGVNNRNLKTFEMDMNLTQKLLPFISKDKIIVAESGINNKETIIHLSNLGVDAFLIGEHFMRQNDITSELLKLKEV